MRKAAIDQMLRRAQHRHVERVGREHREGRAGSERRFAQVAAARLAHHEPSRVACDVRPGGVVQLLIDFRIITDVRCNAVAFALRIFLPVTLFVAERVGRHGIGTPLAALVFGEKQKVQLALLLQRRGRDDERQHEGVACGVADHRAVVRFGHRTRKSSECGIEINQCVLVAVQARRREQVPP